MYLSLRRRSGASSDATIEYTQPDSTCAPAAALAHIPVDPVHVSVLDFMFARLIEYVSLNSCCA